MDVDARRLGTTTETEALERVPCIGIKIVGINIADTIRQMLQVDDIGRPRITNVVVADKYMRIIEQDEASIQIGDDFNRNIAALTCNDEVIEAIDGTRSSSTFAIDKDSNLTGINNSFPIGELYYHRHIVRIEMLIDRREEGRLIGHASKSHQAWSL